MNYRIAVLLVLICLNCANAQTPFPVKDKPITVVVPYPPVPSLSNVSLLVARHLTASLGSPFVVIHKPGATGSIGSKYVAQSRPDGYTLLVSASGPMSINPLVYKNLGYKSEDFVPVAPLSGGVYVLVTAPSFRGRSVQDLAALLKANPGKYNFASTGVGSLPSLSAELLLKEINANATHVPFQTGSQVLTALINSDVLFAFLNVSVIAPFIAEGKIKVLATTSAKRFPLLPDVPTVAESGFPNFAIETYVGLFAPKGTPPDVVKTLNDEISKIMGDPEVVKTLAIQGDLPAISSPEQFRKRVNDELRNWSNLAKSIDLKIE